VINKQWLAVEEGTQSEQSCNGDHRVGADDHRLTNFLIEHPQRQNELVAVLQLNLHVIGPQARTGANYPHGMAKVVQIGIVNA
jgi:hypothetical protein